MLDLTVETLLLLALAGFLAGFIDSIAGGGGLIAVPALLLAGFDPLLALGTNMLQSLFGSGTATVVYARKGLVDPIREAPSATFSVIGAAVGALLASHLPVEAMESALPVVLVAVALYFGLHHKLTDDDRAQRMKPFLFALIIPPILGFYDGVIGAGTGSFLVIAYVELAGHGVLKATAHTKVLNFGSNLGAFIVFAILGAVHWPVGLMMGAMQLLGARLGAAVAVRVGSRLIKPLLVIVCVGMAIRLVLDHGHPIRATLGF